ncbi:MAG: tRNA (guanosine(46)-N7)-methyltransferase TrmB [Pseudomonadota bacterium]
MSNKPHPTRSTESFYGRRKGNALYGRKQRVMDEDLPRLRLPVETEPGPQSVAEFFDNRFTRHQLEIGFGGGEHLTHQARTHPDVGFIGVEPFINGMAKMLGAIEDHSIENVRLYDDDASRLLDWLPENCLDQIDLLYPDPWPKKRHWKRRFVNQPNLTRFARVLKPGGLFRFASDIDTYVNWTLQQVERQGAFTWIANKASDWNEPWEGWVRTRYEAKAIREDRVPCYLEFRLLPKKAA